MLRGIAIVLSLVGVLMLGAVQIASSAAYGDLAIPMSLPHALHAVAPSLLRTLSAGDLRARRRRCIPVNSTKPND